MNLGNKMPVWQMMSAPMLAVVQKSLELSAEETDAGTDLSVMREAYNRERRYWNQGGPEMAQTHDELVVTPDGPVPIRVFVPQTQAGAAALVFIHGGGFILGNLDTHGRIMRQLAHDTGATVIGVDYSLSPEAKFPTALHQCAAVTRYVQEGHFGVNGNLVGLAGDSGGAMLSLATALYLRDQGSIPGLVALVLYYGLFGLGDSLSRRLLGGEFDGMTEDDLAYYMNAYLASPDDLTSPYVDCLNADMAGLSPMFIASAELDPLRDDSAALAAILMIHGVPHRHVMYEGVLHSFLHYSRQLDAARQALLDGAVFFRDAVSQATSNKQ